MWSPPPSSPAFQPRGATASSQKSSVAGRNPCPRLLGRAGPAPIRSGRLRAAGGRRPGRRPAAVWLPPGSLAAAPRAGCFRAAPVAAGGAPCLGRGLAAAAPQGQAAGTPACWPPGRPPPRGSRAAVQPARGKADRRPSGCGAARKAGLPGLQPAERRPQDLELNPSHTPTRERPGITAKPPGLLENLPGVKAEGKQGCLPWEPGPHGRTASPEQAGWRPH